MRAAILLAGVVAVGVGRAADPPKEGAGFPKFQPQEIDARLGIGYGVVVADLNADGKPDLAVADKAEVVWYENPGKEHGTAAWKKRVVTAKTKGDHVAIAAADLDNDGKPELIVVGAWGPHGHPDPNPVYWLKAGPKADDEWAVHTIPNDEPSVHRVRVIEPEAGKPMVVLAPLMGRDATEKGNWMDGRPVRIMGYKVPADPTKPASWKPEVMSDELHVCHGAAPNRADAPQKHGTILLVGSYEGPAVVGRMPEGWATVRFGEGNQANPKGPRGASEVGLGRVRGGQVAATVEPWHGNQVVVYTPPKPAGGLWDRHVVDERLSGGHGVAFADLDGDKADELVGGVREDPDPKAGDKHTERYGVRLYRCTDGKGAKWVRQLLDEGGVAVEDLAVTDLDADGKPDIVAAGRYTRNVRIYWNRGR